jgi:hypothetical protein
MTQAPPVGVGASKVKAKLVIIIVIRTSEGDFRATALVPLATDHPHAH